MSEAVLDADYRCPSDLTVTPLQLRRMMIIGSCLMGGWGDIIAAAPEGCPCDYLLLNNAGVLPPQMPHPPAEYDLQLVQMPLIAVLPETAYYQIPFADVAGYQKLFDESCDRMLIYLDEALRWNREHGILTFVCNMLPPQQNAMGRLLPRYDLRNFVYFFERLNEFLASEIAKRSNVYMLDFDQIVTNFGRRHIQDDAVWPTNHASALSTFDFQHDQDRLEKVQPIDVYYPNKPGAFVHLAWREIRAMLRTLRQVDSVKLVIFDIDDTLWRGVAADAGDDPAGTGPLGGWPLGMIETVNILKRRGILIAVVSKNDEACVRPIWQRILGNRLLIDELAIHRINWRPKAENISEILQALNLLPKNVLFVDDNPAERAAVQAAFPAIRTLGPNPYLWRRILLWSPEMQVSDISAESGARTVMVQAQVAREEQRARMTRAEFLQSLATQVTLGTVDATSDPAFARALELLNKTNQFNTTGQRWSFQDCAAAFARGVVFHVFEVQDRFTAYGVVGVVVVDRTHIAQFVMSCRVVGLDVERAVLAEIVRLIGQAGCDEVTAALVDTAANLLCRDLYREAGFGEQADIWVRPALPVPAAPPHVTLQRRAVPVLAE